MIQAIMEFLNNVLPFITMTTQMICPVATMEIKLEEFLLKTTIMEITLLETTTLVTTTLVTTTLVSTLEITTTMGTSIRLS